MQRYFWTLPIAFLSCAACSTPDDPNKHRQIGPNRPPAQTSLFFAISPPDAGAGCGVRAPGYAPNIGGPPRSSSGDPGMREVDGSSFARIRCRISGSGANYSLDLSAQKGAVTFSLIDGTVSGQTGSGTISMAGTGTGDAQIAGSCQLDLSRQPFMIEPGRVWAGFMCPSVGIPIEAGPACHAQGEFVFENCDE
jgi:hypothetical protein